MNLQEVLSLQKMLNAKGYRDRGGKRLAEDGQLGANTTYALQSMLNQEGYTGLGGGPLSVDGIWGANTQAAYEKFSRGAGVGGKPGGSPVSGNQVSRPGGLSVSQRPVTVSLPVSGNAASTTSWLQQFAPAAITKPVQTNAGSPPLLDKSGDINKARANAKSWQQLLNREGYRDQSGNKLAEDGVWGPKTEYAWQKYQQAANQKAAAAQNQGNLLLRQKMQEDLSAILNKQSERAQSAGQAVQPVPWPPAPSANDPGQQKLAAAMKSDPEATRVFSTPDKIRDQQIALNLLGFTGADGKPLPENGKLDLNTLVAWDRLRHSGSSFGNSNSPVMQAVNGAGGQGAAPAANWLEQQVKSGKPIFTKTTRDEAIKKLDKILEKQYSISESLNQQRIGYASVKNLSKPAMFNIPAEAADQRFDYAMSSIEKNHQSIVKSSQHWGIPPEIIASIILKEQYTRSIPDWLANTSSFEAFSPIGLTAKKITATLQKSENQIVNKLAAKINAPFGPHSTGLGAIFPKTAREAWESALGKEKASRILPAHDLVLQLILTTNDQFNIDTIGAVLKYEAIKLGYTDLSSLTDDQWQKVLVAYNGDNEDAQKYGKKVREYLAPMRDYLSSFNQ